MRSVVGALIVIAALAGSSTAEEIYRWTDSAGTLHFANAPTPGAPRAGVQQLEGSEGSEGSAPTAAPPAEVAYDADGNPTAAAPAAQLVPPDQVADYSTDVSIRRSQLERELKSTESRLKAVDSRLDTLAKARLRNTRGSAATGGVGAPAEDVLSPEEEELVEERDELAQHAVELRNDVAKLRQEVEARLGSVPSWWTDPR
jgi:hypothetical protein